MQTSKIKIKISPKNYIIVETDKPHPQALANITDVDSITSIVEESAFPGITTQNTGHWKLFSIEPSSPSLGKDIKTILTAALKEAEIACLPITAFLQEHFLVKTNNTSTAEEIFKKLGMVVEYSN